MKKPDGAGHMPRLLVLLLTLLFIVGACKKENNPVNTPVPGSQATIPSVAGNWIGAASNGIQGWALNATIAQTADSLLSGDCLWSSMNTDGHNTRCWFIGKVNTAGQVSLQDTGDVPLNWNGQYWNLVSLSGTLNSKKDTLSGSWTGAGNSSGPYSGGFMVVKH